MQLKTEVDMTKFESKLRAQTNYPNLTARQIFAWEQAPFCVLAKETEEVEEKRELLQTYSSSDPIITNYFL